jgi:hypothetical protein
MLGSEYNWLISLTRKANGVPKVRMTSGGLLTLAVAMFCFFCVVLQAANAA